tara:strand:+ start:779 stop:1102 length:324 start_codon:yes stop_codon:yes gene_type:complete
MPKEGDWKTDEYGFVFCGGDWKCRSEIESWFKQKKEPIPIQFRYWESEWTGGPLGIEVLQTPVLVKVEDPESESEEEETPPPPPEPEPKKRGRPKKVIKKVEKGLKK